ncbi:hypothetical protein QE152_g25495 [Popillia japonica]|uniref:Uncharacterized protein n=1 Tax=Popillia japonica TaxID=7064 RepID=A0AAW1K1D1_POPJA
MGPPPCTSLMYDDIMFLRLPESNNNGYSKDLTLVYDNEPFARFTLLIKQPEIRIEEQLEKALVTDEQKNCTRGPNAESLGGSTLPFSDVESTKRSTPLPVAENTTRTTRALAVDMANLEPVCCTSKKKLQKSTSVIAVKAAQGFKQQPEKMQFTSNNKYLPIEVGTSVTVPVSSVQE